VVLIDPSSCPATTQDYEPPETATPVPEVELTEPEDELTEPEDELELEVAVVLEAAAVDEAAVPGIVLALTAPRMPTPATAAKAAPAVRRLSMDSALSRARILSCGFVSSMALGWTRPIKHLCEKAGRLL
jgi:hypothetical protein